MKKGMIIALLMVAMVALAASASAMAPTINELPAVIIGDAGDISDVGTGPATMALRLLRYENVIDLSGAITRYNNPTSTDDMSVFYSVSGTTLEVSNTTAIVPAMSGSEIASLLGGVAPSGRKINTATDTWLTLINGAVGTYASAAAATPEANGSTEADLTAAGALDPQVLTLYATDYDLPTDKVGTGTLVVYSVIDVVDSYSPPPETIYNSGNLGATGHDGWVYDSQDAARSVWPNTNLADVPSTTTADGVGFTGLATFPAGKTQGYSSWVHTGNGIILADVVDLGSKIFCATIKMTGNATSPLLCPSYRLLFLSTGFAHVGGLQVTTTGGTVDTDSAINMPSDSTGTTGVEARMYWGLPRTMNQYGDGEKAATVAAPEDKRAYYMTFDVMQAQAGDIGTIVMETVLIQRIGRPIGATPSLKWGATIGGRPFNEADTLWSHTGTDSGTGWGPGVFTVSDVEVTMRMETTRKSVFCQVNPLVSETAGYPDWESGKLVRITYNLTSSNVDTCPQIRMFVIPWVVPLGTLKAGNLMWGEAMDPSVWRNWYPQSEALGLAGAPKVAGSTIETYAYTMNAPTDTAEACILTPIVDIDQNNVTTFPVNGWSKPGATVSIRGCTMEIFEAPS